jgi:NACHT domain
MIEPLTAFVLSVLGAVLDDIASGVIDTARRSRLRRLANSVAERVDRRIADLRRGELAGMAEHEWRAAVEAVGDSMRAATPIDLDLALEVGLQPEELEERVRAASAKVARAAGLGEQGQVAYDRMLSVACRQIPDLVRSLPEFPEHAQVATLRTVREVRGTIENLPAQLDLRGDAAGREFEHRYLDYVARTMAGLELFGLARGRAPRAQSFDRAYVDLAVARSAGGDRDADDELTGSGVGLANVLADTGRVLLRGGAGAGKTTLLRWLALGVARGTLRVGQRADIVPFFVPLRHFAAGELPAPEELLRTTAKVLAGEMPARWASERFRAGRVLLLVDGLDELPRERRLAAREWLAQLAEEYADARYVVTTRPFAVEDEWLAAADFETFDLLPMSAKAIRDLLRRWHDAARDEHEADPGMRAWLDQCQRGLEELLSTRRELRRLASSPLLCGLLCALYQDRNMHLPRDRKGLYDAALDLLLVRWDEQRGVKVGETLPLSKEEQVVLLQRLAYSLVKNEDMLLSREEATRRIAHAMRGLRPHHASPDQVLQRTLERTGLLREPGPDEVQFVHRTFRDYLAAKEVVDSRDLRHLIEHAHLDQWYDVVVMAVAHARPSEREQVLQGLLAGNAAACGSRRMRDRLHLVAAACLEHADVMDTDQARRMVQDAAARLIPPASLDDAELLAKAGSFVLDLLPGPEGLTETQAACVVRTAAMIGGEGAREKIAEFGGIDDVVVMEELLRAWRQSDDPEDYARAVLADVDFGDRRLDVRGWHRVRHLRHLTRLTNVCCLGDLHPLDPLAAVPNLRRLELMQNEVVRDLSPLVGCRTLRALCLTSCPLVLDLAPLADSTVEELELHMMKADLATLRGAGLRRLGIRDRRLAQGLDPLPADLPLRELAIDNRAADRNLRGIQRWRSLEQVAIFGAPRPDDLAALADLPLLRRLDVRQAASREAVAGIVASLRARGVQVWVDDWPLDAETASADARTPSVPYP